MTHKKDRFWKVDWKLDFKKESRFTRSGIVIISIIVFVGIFLVLADFIFSRIDERLIKETVTIGNEIVKALEQYQEENGSYPDVLNTLVPKYLNDVKAPIWGREVWDYLSLGESEFYLKVDESEKTGDGCSRWLRYFPQHKRWDIGD